MVWKCGNGDPGANSRSLILPHFDQSWQHNLKAPVLIGCVLSLSINDIFFLYFPWRSLLYPQAHLEHNEPCLFAFLFFFFFLIIAFLHQNPHLQSDIADFNPCLYTPHLTSLSGLQSARSTAVSLGSAEEAKAQGEASVGAGDRRKQRRLHFDLFIQSREWEICPMSRDTEMFRTRQAQPCFSALLVCGDMGTIVSGCFVPSTTLVFLQLLEVWWSCGSFPTSIILRLYDFTPDSSATPLEKSPGACKCLVKRQ